MKVVTAQEMARIEKLSFAAGASEEESMERAGFGVAQLVQHVIGREHLIPKICLLCGSGNNAGDAYVAGRILRRGGFEVFAMTLFAQEKCSPLCQLQLNRFKEAGGSIILLADIPSISFHGATLLVDGLLGTGFHGQVEGLMKTLIDLANHSCIPIVSIDIPSGINGTTGEISHSAVMATDTLFLGLPKAGCFTQEGWNHVGKIHIFNFVLSEHFINEAKAEYQLLNHHLIKPLLPKVNRSRHKYQAGYVIGIGGSQGMKGAPLMSSFAALRAGAGIVRLFHPNEVAMGQEGPLEVIKEAFDYENLAPILKEMERASAFFIGPGMGTSQEAKRFLKQLLDDLQKPCVIDAEALTILAEENIVPPKGVILTPHHGEMLRLLKAKEKMSFLDLLKKTNEYAQKHKVTVILKGAPTFILHPEHLPYVCSRGDPGMATAGSGDVLTGILAGILAQIEQPLKAALVATYLHGIAGELAAEKLSSFAMTATDITAFLPQAFTEVLSLKDHRSMLIHSK